MLRRMQQVRREVVLGLRGLLGLELLRQGLLGLLLLLGRALLRRFSR